MAKATARIETENTGDLEGLAASLDAACDRGRFVDAWQRYRALDLRLEAGPARLHLVGARALFHVGAERQSYKIVAALWRREPRRAEVLRAYAFLVWTFRDAYEAWFLLKKQETDPAPADERAELDALACELLTTLGDHDAARRRFDGLDVDAYGPAMAKTLEAGLLLRQDRHEEAATLALEAHAQGPELRYPVQMAAGALTVLGRWEPALELLARADAVMQSGALALQRASIERELGRYEAEHASLERSLALRPLIARHDRSNLHAQLSDNAYRRGLLDLALEHGRAAEHPTFKRMLARLEARGALGPSVTLPVAPIVQHRMTCAPASLAMVCRYFGDAVEHVEVADAICYEGTSSQSERHWVESRGWVSRELTLDWATACALLERGVPFLLLTAEATSAHMQVVVGYDLARGTLAIRDPMSPLLREVDAEAFLADYAHVGPRAHVVLPPTEAHRLDGLELPERGLYDALYRLRRALDGHDRATAQRAYEELATQAPEHRMTLWGQQQLAEYDGNTEAALQAIERLAALHPRDARAQLCILDAMAATKARSELMARLEALVDRPDTPLVFQQRLAALYAEDARTLKRAEAMARRLSRYGVQAEVLSLRSEIAWLSGDREGACELARFAACAEPTNERYANNYAVLSEWLQRPGESLSFLERRVERLGGKASRPLSTLFSALERLGAVDEGVARIERGLRAWPEDGALMLHAAEVYARLGAGERARALLDGARSRVRNADWLRSAIVVAGHGGDPAIPLLEQLIELEPASVPVHRQLAAVLRDVNGPEAEQRHLERAVARMPDNLGLRMLAIEGLREVDPERQLAAIEALIERAPDLAWAHRERAMTLLALGRTDEALQAATHAGLIAPRHLSQFLVMGLVLARRGERRGAEEQFTAALQLDPDAGYALHELLALAPGSEAARGLLDAQFERALRQSCTGQGLFAWHAEACGRVDDDVLVTATARALLERRELAAGWTIHARQLLRLGRTVEAQESARQAVAVMPFAATLWLSLAVAERAGGESAREVDAARRAVELDVHQPDAWLTLADALTRAGRADEAEHELERALGIQRREPRLLRALAEARWNSGRRREALDTLERLVELRAGDGADWALLRHYATQLGEAQRTVEAARRLAEQRPWSAPDWLRLARLLADGNDMEPALGATERALAIDPLDVEAFDLRVVALCALGKKDEALAACEGSPLQGRNRAVVAARRACISADFDDVPRALAEMQQVAAEFPGHDFAWGKIYEWADKVCDRDLMLESARRLVALEPLSAVSHGCLGEALRYNGRHEEALASFEHALELQPGYPFAAEWAITLALEWDGAERAERTLGKLRPHLSIEAAASLEIRVALAQDDHQRALVVFRALAFNPHVFADAIVHCGRLLLDYDGKRFGRAMRSMLTEIGVHPALCRLVSRADRRTEAGVVRWLLAAYVLWKLLSWLAFS